MTSQTFDQAATEQTDALSTATRLLTDLISNYTPTWHYSMEKTGYECNFCLRLAPSRSDLYKAQHHAHDCPYIAALTWRRQQNQPSAQRQG